MEKKAIQETKMTLKEAKKLAKNRHLSGGHLKDIPKPHIRYFDDRRRKREVKVSILKFEGYGIHYHVDIKEEDNPILDIGENHSSGKPCWHACWDDEKGRGKLFAKKFNSTSDAAHYIKEVWHEEFENKTHKLVLSMTSSITWKKRLERLGLKIKE